jgi:hypothetical protein
MRDQVRVGDLAGVVGAAELLELLAESGVLGQDAGRHVLDRVSLGLGRHRAHRTVRLSTGTGTEARGAPGALRRPWLRGAVDPRYLPVPPPVVVY